MEELKEKGKKNKLILIIVGILIVILLSGGIYYFVSLKNNNSDNDNNVQNNTDNNQNSNIYNYDGVYKSDDGKEISLRALEGEQFELISGEKKITVDRPYYLGLTFNVWDDNNWYLLNRNDKKILAYYEDKDVEVNRENFNNIDYYFVGNEGRIVFVVNELGKKIFSFDSNEPDGYLASDNFIYIKSKNNIVKYDLDGKLIETKKYDNILNYTNSSENSFIGLKNNSYYLVDINDEKDIKLELKKIDTYKGKEGNLEIYSVLNDNGALGGSYLDYSKVYLYNNNFYARTIDDVNYGENYDYEGITVDPVINGASQCNFGDFLINKKTKELVEFSRVNVIIEKVSNGYYFIYRGCYLEVPGNYTDGITTSKGKSLLEGYGIYSITGDYITVESKNGLVKYDVNGKVIQNLECNKIYTIYDKYALVKIENKYFVIDLVNKFSKKEVKNMDSIVKLEEFNNFDIYKMTDKEVYFGNYSYNFDTQELTEIYDYDE